MLKVKAFLKAFFENLYWFFGCLAAVIVIAFLLVPFFLCMAWERLAEEIRYRKYGEDFHCREITLVHMNELAGGEADLVVPKDEAGIW